MKYSLLLLLVCIFACVQPQPADDPCTSIAQSAYAIGKENAVKAITEYVAKYYGITSLSYDKLDRLSDSMMLADEPRMKYLIK